MELFSFWHFCDISGGYVGVRFRGQTGKQLLTARLIGFDPKPAKTTSFDHRACERVKREPTLEVAQVHYLAQWPEDRRPRGQAVSCLVLFAATGQMDYRRRTKSA